jgi:4-amino-4-deoxy-L-arabinose transferase-like glycosyltransferase
MKYSKRALLIFVLLAFMYGYYYQDPEANGNSRLGLIFAIVQEGRLTIDSYYDTAGTNTIDRALVNGHYYSDKAIGTSILGVLYYAPMYLLMKLTGHGLDLMHLKYILTVLVIAIPSAFAGSLVYVLCETISGSRLRSYLATLAVALGTMVLPFSAIFFGHQLAGALLFISFFLIFNLKVVPDLRQKSLYLFLIGFLLGAAFLTEYTTAVIILPLALYYCYTLRERLSWRWIRSTILPPVLGAFIPIVILMIYNTLAFGNPFTIGYEHLGNQFQESMSQGFMGISWPRLEVLFYLTFHPAMGLFWQSPVLLMALVGFFFLWRDKRYRLEGIIVLMGFIAYLLINAGYYMWWGGYSFGPRHLIPMLLFLAIPLVLVPRRLIPLVIILAVISIGQMLIPLGGSMLAPDNYFVQNAHLKFFGYSTIYSYSWQQLRMGYFAYNLGGALFGLKNWMVLLPNILAILAVTAIFVIMEKRPLQNNLPEVR